jgi:hypothetical protein
MLSTSVLTLMTVCAKLLVVSHKNKNFKNNKTYKTVVAHFALKAN